jgi:hypothetical protein
MGGWLVWVGLSLLLTMAVQAQMPDEAYEQQRQELRNRQRRIILNNDGCDALYFPATREATPEQLLELRTSPLVGSQVDSVFYCTISSGFGMFTHRTAVGHILVHDVAAALGIKGQYNLTPRLLEQGTDPLQVVTDFCRREGLEIFWSMRMNDTHDGSHRPENPYPLFSPFKAQNPDKLMGSYEQRPPHGLWSAVDYTHPEVRDLAVALVVEVCRNYDVDGVELDFLRHFSYFKSVAWGGVASERERGMMTDLVRQIRQAADREGRRRGRPILVAVRVPDDVEYCHRAGLDLERWLAEGLVDLLSASCYFQLNPWEKIVTLGHRYGVKVYPCLSESRLRVDSGSTWQRMSQQSYRARAQRVWQSGADGVYLFNFFNPRAPMLRELGDPQLLAGLDKVYFANVRNSGGRRDYSHPDFWLAEGRQFQTVSTLSPASPLVLEPGQTQTVEVVVDDDLTTEPPRQATAHLLASGSHRLTVRLNDAVLTGHQTPEGWVEFPLRADILKAGINRFELSVAELTENEEWTTVWNAPAMLATPWRSDRPRPGATVVEVQEGALLVADRGVNIGDYLYFTFPWAAQSKQTTVAEVEVKVKSGENSLLLYNDMHNERLLLRPDGISLYHVPLRYDFDTTDRFHTYRVVMQGTDIQVLVDGVLRLDGRGQLSQPAQGRNDFAFGAASSTTLGEALWRAVRLRSAGTVLYDLAVAIQRQH